MSEMTSIRSSSPSSSSTNTSSSETSLSSLSAATSSNASVVATRASSTASSSSKTSATVGGGWLAEKIHSSFLICKLCFEVYTSPKCLSCLHTFCEACIENLLHESDLMSVYRKYTTDYREVVCPLCRKRTQVPLGGTRRLPDNFLIEGLSETLIRQKPPKFPQCDICKLVSKTSREANSKCLECQRLMCPDCLVMHAHTKVTSGHTVFDVEIEKEIECKDHEDEIVRFYCDTCSTCICIMCTFNEHKEHDILGFHEAAQKHQGKVKRMTDVCKKNLISSEKELESIESCESLITSVEQFIKNKAIEMTKEIKYKEKQLLDQLKKIYGKQCLDRISKKKELILRMEECKSACKLVDAVLDGKEIEFLLLRSKVEEKLQVLNKTPKKKLPATIGKVLEYRPGSLNFGYLYDYDDPQPTLTCLSSADNINNSIEGNDNINNSHNNNNNNNNNNNSNNNNNNNNSIDDNNKPCLKRKSKTAIEINYVTAYYGGGQNHTCSIDTQTDDVDFKKMIEPSKTKKTLENSKKKISSKEASTNISSKSAQTALTSQATVVRNGESLSTSSSSLQQLDNKTTQKSTRPSSSSSTSSTTSSTMKGSLSSSSVLSSSSSSSSSSSLIVQPTQRNSIETMPHLPKTIPDSQCATKTRRVLKHLGSSVESFSSYDEDGHVFIHEDLPLIKSGKNEIKRHHPSLSSISSSSFSSSKQSVSPVISLSSTSPLSAVLPSIASTASASVASVAPVVKTSSNLTDATGINVEKKQASITAPNMNAVLTFKNTLPTIENVASTIQNVASTTQNITTKSQDVPSTTQTTTSKPNKVASTSQNISPVTQNIVSTSPNVVKTSQNISPTIVNVSQPNLQQSSICLTSALNKPVVITRSPSSSLSSSSQSSTHSKPLSSPSQAISITTNTNASSSSSSTPLSNTTKSASSSSPSSSQPLNINNLSQKMIVETKLQHAPIVLKSAPSLRPPLVPITASLSSSDSPNPSSSPPQLPVALKPSTSLSLPATVSSLVSSPSLTPSSLSSSSLTSSASSTSSSSSSPPNVSKSQSVAPTTMQLTRSGSLKIVATVAPTINYPYKHSPFNTPQPSSSLSTSSPQPPSSLSTSSPLTSSSSSSSQPATSSSPLVENKDGKSPDKDKDGNKIDNNPPTTKVSSSSSTTKVTSSSSSFISSSSPTTTTTAATHDAVVYRKRREKSDKEMTHLADSPIFRQPYSYGEPGKTNHLSRHNSLLYPSSYHRHSYLSPSSPSSSSSSQFGSASPHRMSDGSLYSRHKFY